DLKGEYYATEMWHETHSRMDGTIRRDTRYPNSIKEWILSGPHFFVANPFQASARENCSHNKDYDDVDLISIPDDYLPRTNYVPACSAEEYRRRTPSFQDKPLTEFYRHVHRRQLSPSGERTLINAIVPPGTAHIHPVMSVTFADVTTLLLFSGLA